MIEYPKIDPVLFDLGFAKIKWYGVAYVLGILLGYFYIHKMNDKIKAVSRTAIESDLITYMILGIIIGGRLGHVLFYGLSYYLTYPLRILYIWNGGMSFHGGLIGACMAAYYFCKKYNTSLLPFADMLACATPIGLFFGRIANFINAELYGRPTDVEWAMIFPGAGSMPRHPSQLYEAGLEGLGLFAITFYLFYFTTATKKPGFITGTFLMCYGIFRFLIENYREPDKNIGFMFHEMTMGQLLSIPMFLIGLWLCLYAWMHKPAPKTQRLHDNPNRANTGL